MHALLFTGTGGGDVSRICVFFRADGDVVSLPVLVFFLADFRLVSGEVNEAFFLRFFLVFGASGEVDISMSGS
jgi:hypothetical protein